MTEEIIIPFDELDEKDRIVALLQKIGECEEAVAALYRTYAAVWPQDRQFWESLAKAEDGHRAYIAHLVVLVSERPYDFKQKSPLSPEMLQNFIAKTALHAQMARGGLLNEKQALYEAHQIENLSIESELGLLFESGNDEFQRLSAAILSEEKEHRDDILRLIKERYPHAGH